ncbi:MAG TPA: trehalase family glycosidase [Candidatus Melainabacteria bacterium]|nr:trehalase family glycosidase [Candidatus Melainabacteria bacterium]
MPTASTTAQAKKLKAFFLEKAKTCIHEPKGMLKHRFVTPSYDVVAGGDDASEVSDRSLTGHYLQMYDWDACFFSQASVKAGIAGLAQDVVENFLSLQEGDGHIPRTVSPSRIWDNGDQCKPFLAQTLLFAAEQNPKAAAIEQRHLEGLDCYLKYFDSKRKHKSGLYFWRNVLESGVDDNLALLYPLEAAKGENDDIANFPDGRLLAADINAYLVAEFRAMNELAKIAGNEKMATEYAVKAVELSEKIDSMLWSQKDSIYYNYDPETQQHCRLRAWTGLCPVLMGTTNKERTQAVIEKNIMSGEHFFRNAGIASVAASEPLYNQAKRGLYGRVICSNWQGPMWVLPNALAVRALLRENFAESAQRIAERVINTLANGLETRGTLFENYHADTGEPLFAPQFMSWNSLCLELLGILE